MYKNLDNYLCSFYLIEMLKLIYYLGNETVNVNMNYNLLILIYRNLVLLFGGNHFTDSFYTW